ncbi:D-alanine--D-alanine ligase family protein [Clostridium sp. E02]|uniref:D-alanine--D-alanine ligase family protein n=1 Tax=Clostridium sp. E02 TaxID=2487134 RepID=UPI000F539C92|nr:D-alanine--D-alanine ligase family protein [Clostridium sp. E02]
MKKNTVVVLYGGQSSEHVVSCMSVINVIDHIDQEKYDLLLIGITEEGHWIKTDSVNQIKDGTWKNGNVTAILSPDASMKSVVLLHGEKAEMIHVDVVFPVLHGLLGEDGTVQGLLELSKIPYVGCGVLASAISMDKLYTKIIADHLGVTQADYIPVYGYELEKIDPIIKKVEEKFHYPVFVKPSNAGSSKGVSRAGDREALIKALQEASKYDQKILVEEMIVGREIECAVLGGGNTPVRTSGVGEILATAEFYDFDAKYHDSSSKTVLNPDLLEGTAEGIRKTAESIFRAVDGYGLSRVDFFVKEDGTIVFNEINTMPGFTGISMYPMLWEEAGIKKEELVDSLLELGMNRV